MDQKKLCQIAAICGAAVFLGCLLPWASFDIPAQAVAAAKAMGVSIPDSSISGTHGEWTAGVLVLILGLVGGAAAALTGFGYVKAVPLPQKKQWLIAAACLGVAALFVIINFFKDFDGPVSRGIGMWLSLAGALGGTACMVMVLKNAGMLPQPDASGNGDAKDDAKDEAKDDAGGEG